jgi:Ion channel
MTNNTSESHRITLHLDVSEFWSGDLGLTLVTISLVILLFVITPMRDAGLDGRIFFELLMLGLMIFGALSVPQGRVFAYLVIGFVLVDAIVLAAGRIHPTPFLELLGSTLTTISLILYVRIVLLVMFRVGRITWSRIQGGVSAYLLIGLTWASAYSVMEQLWPGSFRFVSVPTSQDQLTAKLTYFSFCTLTTVGGEIMPFLPFARSLAIAEAVVGQLFPAILIGALVSMAMRSNQKP